MSSALGWPAGEVPVAGAGACPALELLPLVGVVAVCWPNDETASAVAVKNTVTIKEVFIGALFKCVAQTSSARWNYQPRTFAKINGATMVASDSTIKRGVFARSLPQVIFSFGTAPE